MKLLTLFIFILAINASAFAQQPNELNEVLPLLEDFRKSAHTFTQEIYDWDVTGDPWAASFWYFNKEKNYNVLQTEHFIDSGRYETYFIVDDSLNMKLITRIFHLYDKKWNDPSMKVTTHQEYYLFTKGILKRYGRQMKEISDPETNKQLKEKFEKNFEEFKVKNKLKTS